ncbi:MAG: 3-dehydroquinate synthase [Chitinophagaceae bacterium]|jgi:3-dehydroquinate synthase|nr:3-dehydroquinate synthase [Chitinophagaceae bacterium]
MISKKFDIQGSRVDYFFGARLKELADVCDRRSTILVTDENVFAAHSTRFKGWQTMVLKAGEANKQQWAIDSLLAQLMEREADRSFTLVGIGGGVVTDMVGYAAAVYMRGIRCGFVPTTLLAMVDAAIGGKNGVDAGIYKNLVGTIRQPAFLLYDTSLLSTLPEAEWQHGFAEIIKHAAIKKLSMFKELQAHDLQYYRRKKASLEALIQQNALLKTKIVQADPFEKADRKLLNFGHTLGHAIENDTGLAHGQAVAIGMVYAAHLSQQLLGFRQTLSLVDCIEQYGLPTHARFDMAKALQNMRLDKKRERQALHFVLLEKLGKANVQLVDFPQLENILLSLDTKA